MKRIVQLWVGPAIWIAALVLAVFAGVLPSAVALSEVGPVYWGTVAFVFVAAFGLFSLSTAAMISAMAKDWPAEAVVKIVVGTVFLAVEVATLAFVAFFTPTAF